MNSDEIVPVFDVATNVGMLATGSTLPLPVVIETPDGDYLQIAKVKFVTTNGGMVVILAKEWDDEQDHEVEGTVAPLGIIEIVPELPEL